MKYKRTIIEEAQEIIKGMEDGFLLDCHRNCKEVSQYGDSICKTCPSKIATPYIWMEDASDYYRQRINYGDYIVGEQDEYRCIWPKDEFEREFIKVN